MKIDHKTLKELQTAAAIDLIKNITGPGTPSKPYQSALAEFAKAAGILASYH